MTFPVVYYHHIGGRGGKFPIEIPPPLRDSVSLTLYDADISCVEEMKNKVDKSEFADVEILPYCLAGQEGQADFIITKQPTNCSLLPADPEVYGYIRNSPKFGAMRLGEMLSAHSVEKLNTTILSSVIENENKPQPDFISLDIQGGEYDVISSSENIFREAILINAEAMFMPMYKGQKTFCDIHTLMTKLGFILIDLQLYDPHHLCRTPLDFNAKGFLLDGEAFYIKKPDMENWTFEKLLKYCFAAILCHQTHLCLKVFEVLDSKFSEEINSLRNMPSYMSLVKELYEAHKHAPKCYLPFFNESRTYRNYHKIDISAPIVTEYNETMARIEDMGENKYSEVLEKYGLNTFVKSIELTKQTNIESLKNISSEFSI